VFEDVIATGGAGGRWGHGGRGGRGGQRGGGGGADSWRRPHRPAWGEALAPGAISASTYKLVLGMPLAPLVGGGVATLHARSKGGSRRQPQQQHHALVSSGGGGGGGGGGGSGGGGGGRSGNDGNDGNDGTGGLLLSRTDAIPMSASDLHDLLPDFGGFLDPACAAYGKGLQNLQSTEYRVRIAECGFE
jgi:hypothetical protein